MDTGVEIERLCCPCLYKAKMIKKSLHHCHPSNGLKFGGYSVCILFSAVCVTHIDGDGVVFVWSHVPMEKS